MDMALDTISKVYDRVRKLGFFPTAFIPMFKYASVVAIKGESRYNLWITYDGKDVLQAFLLKYSMNSEEVDKIDRVIRISIPVK